MWHTFEGVLREAEQFVTTQTPMKAQGLQQSIEVHVKYNKIIAKLIMMRAYIHIHVRHTGPIVMALVVIFL